MQLGFNEAGMFKSRSILIYYSTEQTICTRMNGLMLWLIEKGKRQTLREGASEERVS